ncbi:MAG: autotransporter outer membrane beta-barrel domain-containing protein [Parachlamydiales bacterium]|nr:autotransporter outer membrane beta-barrel domain-containing protein [Candidatus Acheromyda pituitae]
MNKKFFSLFLFFPFACIADTPTGILGGQDNGVPWAAFLDGSGTILPIQASLLPSSGVIESVDINNFGQAIIGGNGQSNAYAAFTNWPEVLSSVAGLPANITLTSVGINDSKKAIIGGTGTIQRGCGCGIGGGGDIYVALISPDEVVNTIEYGTPTGSINAVAINNAGYCIATGKGNVNSAYALVIDPSGNPTVYHNGGPPGYYYAAAISESNMAIDAGGDGGSSGSWAAFVSPLGVETHLPISGGPMPSAGGSQIQCAAINSSNNAIIGGCNTITGCGGAGTSASYAGLVSSTGFVTNLPVSGDPLPATGEIRSASINDSGFGIIGGFSGPAAYAALVSPTGVVQNLPMPSNGVIYSVAINEQGAGLVGGKSGTAAYAAVVSPTGQVVTLSGLPAIGVINSVAVGSFFSHIPTNGLTQNNKRYAKYINKYVPQDTFYFLPAIFDGTLNQALESAAPTRNAAAVYAADNNMFSLNRGLSTHLRNHRLSTLRVKPVHRSQATAFTDDFVSNFDEFDDVDYSTELIAYADDEFFEEDDLLEQEDWIADREILEEKQIPLCGSSTANDRLYTLWFDAIGYLASQKKQHQTVGFDPYSAGVILGLDRSLNDHWKIGGGAAYTFTHIHEHHRAGHSDINQEYLFVYGTWASTHFYVDGALWGGHFQIHNVRKIHMTGWDFRATSHPKGWQLTPHLEFGYERMFQTYWLKQPGQYSAWIINPFAMFDWANNWQNSYHERGNGPFNAAQKSHHSSFLRSEAGLRFYELWSFCSWRFILEEGISYVNKKPFEVGTMNAFLVGSPGNFTMETLTGTQNLASAEVSMTFQPVNRIYPYGSLTYQGEYNGSFQSHQLTLETSWDF